MRFLNRDPTDPPAAPASAAGEASGESNPLPFLKEEGREPPSGAGGQALLIGIDSYPCFPPGVQLKGAVQDAENLAGMLRRDFGFDPWQIEVLINEQATREGIIGGLERLLRRTRKGEAVVVHFSGHGSRRLVPGCSYRGDDLENVLVTHDSGHDGLHPNLDLSGSELYAWLRHLSARTPRITLILDCCHAGALPRGQSAAGLGRARTLDSDSRPLETLPFPWSFDNTELPRAGSSDWLSASQSFTLIAACRGKELAREVSLEEGGVCLTRGALSDALLRALPGAAEGSTYSDLLPALTARIRGLYPEQHPQIEGARDRLIFGLEERRPRREVLVAAVEGRRLILDAGCLHGVGVGSVWGLHASSIDEPSLGPPGGEPEWRAEVTLVTGVRSDAVLLPEESAVGLPVGARAIELLPAALP